MNQKLVVSPSPHVHSGDSVSKNMYGVIIALIPALLASLWYFGIGALIVTLTAIVACVLFEWIIQKYLMKTTPSISDGSAALTGLLLAFNLPTNIPIGLIIIGAAVAIGIGKMSFGGLGNNPFNPALVGRVFLLISFPVQMTSWPVPVTSRFQYLDATTGATPLSVMKEGLSSGASFSEIMSEIPSYLNLFMGNMGGSAGEVAGIALVLGGIYLLVRKIITWHIPVSVIGSIAVFTAILHFASPDAYAGPLFHILTGGVLLGAFFMATDYVSSPMSKRGMLLYGVGIGVITVLIRVYGSYPEGVSFAILIMNAFVPLIDRYMKPKRFGEKIKTAKVQQQ
ncbi:RnfABCDGE type electron transport complex subunit D [Marinilabilia salmonicolor]|jgi:electron transport complex protein RnfD|uniref:Ion-translocating oxidoreductase complex subunit D n=1 Tax=Marinilabilia salmonicolor TaxID=989 RepID=A0A2T0XDL6_9BACT|nr:RnfABCDGE type electron transport complex subunit D [Marinilabilia salmonicolor]PRY96970.1 electron transport complex protein RnfD [Marinilabilia salmonicolor]RCW36672.1 electron transport complex protein RnfD [Marinilabilia salmonicolor]